MKRTVSFLVLFLFVSISTANGAWQSIYPEPTQNTLNDVWGYGDMVWLVGDSGVIFQYDGYIWTQMHSPTDQTLNKIWGTSAQDVFAVGSGGTIIHYNGTTWETMTSNTTNNLWGIWGNAANDVFAVGDGGVVLRYNGNQWTVMDTPTSYNLYAVWGSSATSVYAVGKALTILRFDGNSWQTVDHGQLGGFSGYNFYTIWGADENDIFVSGPVTSGEGNILHYDGAAWSTFEETLTNIHLNGLWGTSGYNVYAVGDGGEIFHFDGSDWAQMEKIAYGDMYANIGSLDLNGIWGRSQRDIYAVGEKGKVLHYDGIRWTRIFGTNYTTEISDMCGNSANDMYAIERYGQIYHYDGSEWTEFHKIHSDATELSIGCSGDALMIVGSNGTSLYFDGKDWFEWSETDYIEGATVSGLYDVWVSDAGNFYVAGSDGTILHFDGTTWTQMPTDTDATLRNIWGVSETDMFAVGGIGTILHLAGNTWTTMANDTSANFMVGIWGSAVNDVFAISDDGTIIHYNGNTWSEMTVPAEISGGLNALWGDSSSNVIAVGDAGRILRHDGASWTQMNSGTSSWLYGLWGDSGIFYAVGDYHTILQYPPFMAIQLAKRPKEGDAAVQGQVLLKEPLAFDVDVILASSDISELTIAQPGVTISAGETSVDFSTTVQDDALVDGSQPVIITAYLSGAEVGKTSVWVDDNESASLHVQLPPNKYENVGVRPEAGKVLVKDANGIPIPVDDDVTVWLTSGDTSEVMVPHFVVVRKGNSEAVFDLMIVRDNLNDGDQSVTITADVPGWTPGQADILIKDGEGNEPPQISEIPDIGSYVGSTIPTIYFSVKDRETTDHENLSVWAWSSNQELIPDENLTITIDNMSTYTNRRLKIEPADDQKGSAVITIVVWDGENITNTNIIVEIDDGDDPIVNLSTPVDNATYDGLIRIQGKASDTVSPISMIRLQIKGNNQYLDENGNWSSFEKWLFLDLDGNWRAGTKKLDDLQLKEISFSFNTEQVNWTPGIWYTVDVDAYDADNNESTMSPVDFKIDTGLPWSESSIDCVFKQFDEPKDSIIIGDPLAVTGTISVDQSVTMEASYVDIEFLPPSGGVLHKTVLSDADGAFRYDVPCGLFNSAGNWEVKTSWSGIGDKQVKGSSGSAATLVVAKAASSLSLDIASSNFNSGESIVIKGQLTVEPECTDGLINIPMDELEILITGPGYSRTVTPAYTSTGHFSFIDPDDTALFKASGEWTVKASFDGNAAFQAADPVEYKFNIRNTAGYAVVVQGKLASNEGLDSHAKTSTFVYEKLKEKGLPDGDIQFFRHSPLAPNEGVVIDDDTPTKDEVEQAIVTTAKNKITANPANLYIVLVDHGIEKNFYVNDPETISSTELAGWLDQLDPVLSANNVKAIVILGFCFSGSFINEISGENRIIITSAGPDEFSFKGPQDEDGIRDGEYFVSEFFRHISAGKDIKQSFSDAVTITETYTTFDSVNTYAPYFDYAVQHPLLDDNGDGVGSNDVSDPDGDGAVSAGITIGEKESIKTAAEPVTITEVAPTIFLGTDENSTDDLWAKVENNLTLKPVWIEVKPLGYDAVQNVSEQVEMTLEKYEGTYNGDRYIWTHVNAFTDPGTYQVLYFIKKETFGEISPLMVTIVYKAKAGNQPPAQFALSSPTDGFQMSSLGIKLGCSAASGENCFYPLQWQKAADPEGGAVSYTVLFSKSSVSFENEANLYDFKIEGLTDSVYPTDLPNEWDGKTIYWKVLAIDQYGATTSSNIKSFEIVNIYNPPTGTIKGHVYDAATSLGIEEATVTVGANVITTAARGYYSSGMKPGTYDVTVSGQGYTDQERFGVKVLSGVTVQYEFAMIKPGTILAGDINDDETVDLTDAVMALQILTGFTPSGIQLNADVDTDGLIGVGEAVYILQFVAGLR